VAELLPEAEFPIKLARRAKLGHDDRGDYNPPMGYAGSGVPWRVPSKSAGRTTWPDAGDVGEG
jgi:hypothetical protein